MGIKSRTGQPIHPAPKRITLAIVDQGLCRLDLSEEGDGRSLPEQEAVPCPNRQRVGALEVANFPIFKPRSQQKARLRKILGEESDIIHYTCPCT